MLHVTDKAKEKIKVMLTNNTDDPDKRIRITQSTNKPGNLEFILDNQKKEDSVIKSEDGTNVLVIDESVFKKLNGLILDYNETPEQEGFSLKRASS